MTSTGGNQFSQITGTSGNQFGNIDVDIVCSSDWMIDMAKASPILKHQKNYHKIPLGIDFKKFEWEHEMVKSVAKKEKVGNKNKNKK